MVDASDRVPIEPQSIIAPLSRAAVFLVLTIDGAPEAIQTVRRVIADIGGLVRAVGFRDLDGRLSCNVAIGSAAWDRFGAVEPSRSTAAFC
jgi:putative iron-dependent peroxidase